MLYLNGKKVKVITGANGFDFETKVNAFLTKLAEKGTDCEVQMDPTAGFIAYIHYKEQVAVPECVADEYEKVGEIFTCGECPFYVRPDDGRRRYTKCSKGFGLKKKDSKCCTDFYDWLDRGEVTLVKQPDWKGGTDEA